MADHEPKPPASSGGDEGGFDKEKLKEQLDDAAKKAKTAAGLAGRIIRPMLPKKWTAKHILIAVAIAILLFAGLKFLLDSVWMVVKWTVPLALLIVGVYFIFFAKK